MVVKWDIEADYHDSTSTSQKQKEIPDFQADFKPHRARVKAFA